ncbi:MAG: prephenate dehydratase [Rhodospirillales bacterium]|nr:prephenate dehydratase [Rhodospirillales bacterium]
MSESNTTIAFQGSPGAYSDMACRSAYPEMTTLPCRTFPDTFEAVRSGDARLAMIPIDNTIAGRVADIHHLLPESDLHIIAEHFERVNHHLLGVPGADIFGITHVHSHVHALNQCGKLIRSLGVEPVVHADTAGAAADIAALGDTTQAAIASELAAEMDGLVSLQANIEDAAHNTTRFVVMADEARDPGVDTDNVMTGFIFRVRNVPAALYKSLGGFATNGINLTKLESYVDAGFVAAQFFADAEGHPEQKALKRALEELEFITHEIKILGVYPAHPFRLQQNGNGEG